MDKNKVLEIFYETIKDSMEVAFGDKNCHYPYFVDGILCMTENILEEFDKKVCEDEDKNEDEEPQFVFRKTVPGCADPQLRGFKN